MPAITWIVLLASFSFTAFGSNTITGWVRNQSHGRPAVGDEVILFRLDQGIQEEGRTRTDAQGQFWLTMQHHDKPYLVRVKHQNVDYDQRAPVGGVITIAVFDVADHVSGISGTIEILRAGKIGKSLHVSDMFEIENASIPSFTQSGEPTFEVYLPPNAKVDSVLAVGPKNIGVMLSALPVSGKPGHYAVNFPLLPGTTKFAFNYDLPYNGYAEFRTWHAYPLQQLAVMIPTTMKFSSLSSRFQILRTGASNYHVRAVGQVMTGQGPTFTISGTGDFPPLPDRSETKVSSQPPVLPKSTTSGFDDRAPPLSGHTNLDFRTSSLWPMLQSLLVCCALLASCTFIAWQAHKVYKKAIQGPQIPFAVRPTTLLDGLKDELFQLESDKTRGSISGEEYASARQAMQHIVERAVAGKRPLARRPAPQPD